jgi:ATP-dependent Clp protease ATP-binding subunit ClpA
MDEAGALAQLTRAFSTMGTDTTDEDEDDETNFPVVTEHTVAEVISEWTSIPLGKLEAGEMERLIRLEEDMTQRVKGQSRAIQAVSRAVRRARSGLRDPNRPVASFMFCGPTGTG